MAAVVSQACCATCLVPAVRRTVTHVAPDTWHVLVVPSVNKVLDPSLLIELHDDRRVHCLFKVESVDGIVLLLNVLNLLWRILDHSPRRRRGA